MPPTINLGVKDLHDFVFRFTINFDGQRRRLDAVQDGVGNGRFELGDMEDWVNGPHGVGKVEGVRMGAQMHDNLEWTKVFLGKLFRRSGGAEVLGLDKGQRSDFESGSG